MELERCKVRITAMTSRIATVATFTVLFAVCAFAQERVVRNVPYVTNAEILQRLDLYLPSAQNFPTVLFIHGGSLTGGDRDDDDYRGVCSPFAASGVACATVNYRLFPAVKWPAPEQDLAAAFAWLHSHIRTYGGTPSRLFLFGHSSGCLLGSLLATDHAYLAAQKLSPHDIAGVVAMGCRLNDVPDVHGATPQQIREHFAKDEYDGGFGSVEALVNAVPATHVSSGMPSFLVLIAEAEQFQPPILADAKVFVSRARAAGIKADYFVLKGLNHYTAIHNARSAEDPTFKLILQFVVK